MPEIPKSPPMPEVPAPHRMKCDSSSARGKGRGGKGRAGGPRKVKGQK